MFFELGIIWSWIRSYRTRVFVTIGVQPCWRLLLILTALVILSLIVSFPLFNHTKQCLGLETSCAFFCLQVSLVNLHYNMLFGWKVPTIYILILSSEFWVLNLDHKDNFPFFSHSIVFSGLEVHQIFLNNRLIAAQSQFWFMSSLVVVVVALFFLFGRYVQQWRQSGNHMYACSFETLLMFRNWMGENAFIYMF